MLRVIGGALFRGRVLQSQVIRSSSSYVDLNKDSSTGVATLTLSKKPVNSLNLELLSEISSSLDQLHNDKSCRGLVLTSSLPKVFCAGLDIMEMYNPQEERLRQFWRALQDVWIKLYGSKLATIAAINGNSPAGGCLLSLCCDVRIMAQGPFSIGLNETKLGIVAPFWFEDTMVNVIGQRETERALMLGTLYPTEQALRVGLVDHLTPLEDLQEAVLSEMNKYLAIPNAARILTKQQLRTPTIQNMLARREADIDTFVAFATTDAVQKSLGLYIQALKAKAAKK